MNKINYRIQRSDNLNDVYYLPETGPGGGYHDYVVTTKDCGWEKDMPTDKNNVLLVISFQKGPRNDSNSVHGVLDQDLLEIVRHRLQAFQEGAYRTREGALALTAVEEALLWLAKRSNDRAERGVLGTMEK